MQLLTKFKICSRNQIATILFSQNSNPINVCNRVLKRMVREGAILQVKRERDKPYLYTDNPSHIHHRSNKINHYLKIVDFYIQAGTPENFLVEPILGSYEPDVMFKDKSNNTICVEIQLTPISLKKMETKINQFVSEFNKEHDSTRILICSDYDYKIKSRKDFKIIKKSLPREL
jgi:hypothetical protein